MGGGGLAVGGGGLGLIGIVAFLLINYLSGGGLGAIGIGPIRLCTRRLLLARRPLTLDVSSYAGVLDKDATGSLVDRATLDGDIAFRAYLILGSAQQSAAHVRISPFFVRRILLR